MAQGAADQPLATDPLEDRFGPVEAITDELLSSAVDLPLVEPLAVRASSRGDLTAPTRALWFLGVVVTALLALQAVELLLPRLAKESPATAGVAPSGTVPTAEPGSAQRLDRTLRDSRVQLSRGLYEEVLRVIEPLAESAGLLDANQRFEAYLLLARAHRALGNVERAQSWSLRAMDQSVERREPAQVLEQASALLAEGRHDLSRHTLCQLLARADGLTIKDSGSRDLAEARVGDTWYAQAQATGHLAPLPGATAAERSR